MKNLIEFINDFMVESYSDYITDKQLQNLEEGELRRGGLGEPELVKKPGPNKGTGAGKRTTDVPAGIKHKKGDSVSGHLNMKGKTVHVKGVVTGMGSKNSWVKPHDDYAKKTGLMSGVHYKVPHENITKD